MNWIDLKEEKDNKTVDFLKYLALLSDVDQTITSTSNKVSEATKKAFQALIMDGKYVAAACTGRGYPMLLQEGILDLFAPNTPHVCCGGSLVITKEGETLWHKSLDNSVVEELFATAEASGSAVAVKAATAIYANQTATELYSRFTSRYASIFQPITSDGEWKTQPILSMTTAQPTPEVEELLSKLPVTLKTTESYYGHKLIDITPVGVTKVAGFEAWCDITGIKPEYCIGAGDSSNDLEFLQRVGYAVAVGNALPEIKAVADEVVGHTDQDGLATFISTNLL